MPEASPQHGRKARGSRSNRLGIAALAFILLAGGAAGVIAAWHGPSPGQRAAPSVHGSASSAPSPGTATWMPTPHSTFEGIWPQQGLAEVRTAQSRADAGDPAYTWELDSKEVALRFARQQLWWPRAFAATQFQGKGVRELVYDVSTCPPTGSDCFDELQRGGARAQITVRRLRDGHETSVWTITQVDDPSLVLNVRPGVEVPDGAPLIGFTLAKEGSAITVGYAYGGPCDARVQAVDLTVASYRVDFTADLSTFPSPCPTSGSAASDLPSGGYVFLVTPGRLGGTPFDQRTGGTRMVDFTAIPVIFGPRLVVASNPRYLRWPTGPQRRLGRHRGEILRVKTNLPDGTRVAEYIFSKDLETPAFEMVNGHILDLGIANNDCHEVSGTLNGTKVTITLTVAPVYPWPGSCPPPGWAGCVGIPQTPSVLAFLGRHFERAAGAQVEAHGSDYWIVARHTYQFPAETCTAKFVGSRQVPIKP